tara:strand:+ start:184 stop:1029 length:846 start_codon:yes stop_codon:yes gene_type:complete
MDCLLDRNRVRAALECDGYMLLRSAVDEGVVEELRETTERCAASESIDVAGLTIPSFLALQEYAPFRETLLSNRAVLECLDAVCGKEHRFLHHSDISIDRPSFWHKDRLNGPFRRFESLSPWETTRDGETMKIYKLLLYLQDHRDNNDSLKIIPGSHLRSEICVTGEKVVQLRPKLGDAIIFDQRLTHSGTHNPAPSFRASSPPRILVTLGFGANNIFSDDFERGTLARQSEWRARASPPSGPILRAARFVGRALKHILPIVYITFPPELVLCLASFFYET